MPRAHEMAPDTRPDAAGSTRQLDGSAWLGGTHRHARVAGGGQVHADLGLWAWLGRMTGSVNRSYRVAMHRHDDPYIDPDRWLARVPQVEGSWWPAWDQWLTRHAGTHVPPPMPDAVPAPGAYVLQQ